MPIYEYFCSNCNLKFEKLKLMNQSSESSLCTSCGNSAERVLSRFCRSNKGAPSSVGVSACSACSSSNCSSCSVSG
jgi:putative FmdB family regulatory protein